jgi:hypothetical protein
MIAKRIAAAVLGGLLLASAATVVISTPAMADTTCASGDLCFWVNENKGGLKGRVSGTNRRWSAFIQSQCQTGTWDNCASSVQNNGAHCDARVFSAFDFGGPQLLVHRGEYIANLQDRDDGLGLFEDWGDRISSNDWTNCN